MLIALHGGTSAASNLAARRRLAESASPLLVPLMLVLDQAGICAARDGHQFIVRASLQDVTILQGQRNMSATWSSPPQQPWTDDQPGFC